MAATSGSLYAQGNYDPLQVLTTTGVPNLITANTPLDFRSAVRPLSLDFAIGFATDEAAVPNAFLDSVTVSLESRQFPGLIGYYFVLDAFGLVKAPPTPGAIPLDASTISLTPMLFPTGLSTLAHQTAYRVLVPVPDSLADQFNDLHLDLFDNGDALNSLAWASAVHVVPEPRGAMLLAVGLVVSVGWMRRIRR